MLLGLVQTFMYVSIVVVMKHVLKLRSVQAVQSPTFFEICVHSHRPFSFPSYSVSLESVIVSLVGVMVKRNIGEGILERIVNSHIPGGLLGELRQSISRLRVDLVLRNGYNIPTGFGRSASHLISVPAYYRSRQL